MSQYHPQSRESPTPFVRVHMYETFDNLKHLYLCSTKQCSVVVIRTDIEAILAGFKSYLCHL